MNGKQGLGQTLAKFTWFDHPEESFSFKVVLSVPKALPPVKISSPSVISGNKPPDGNTILFCIEIL